MSSKPQQFVAVAALLGLALGATSCSSTPSSQQDDAVAPAVTAAPEQASARVADHTGDEPVHAKNHAKNDVASHGEVTVQRETVQRDQGSPTATPVQGRQVAAAPSTEPAPNRSAYSGGAVIHARSSAPRPVPKNMGARLEVTELRCEAEKAVSEFDFVKAQALYRQLRDHKATPSGKRKVFHTAFSEAADFEYKMRRIQEFVDRGDHARAEKMTKRLAKTHPEVPVAQLLTQRANQQRRVR